jgi:hypothetical protein
MASDLSRALQILVGTLFATLVCARAVAHTAIRYDDDLLIRIEGDTAAVEPQLSAWGISPWRDHPPPRGALFHVPARARAQLDISGIDYVVVESDLQAALERGRALGVPRTEGPAADFFAEFRTLEEIEAQLATWVAADPQRVQAMEVGVSLEGRTISAIRVSDAPDDAPTVLLDGTQHAREWIATMATMYIADAFVNPAGDPEIEALLSQVAFVIVPVANPDGYAHTWERERLWRKNRRDGIGVDLNRNWPVAWGGAGSSPIPDANNYRGSAALSEPEAAAMADFAAQLPRLVAHVDIHCYGQLVLTPWSWGLDEPPALDVLEPLGNAVASAMADVAGSDYDAIRAAQLYSAAGTFPDYTYGTLGARSFTFELRPRDADPFDVGFVLGADQIHPTGQEALAGVLVIAAAAVDAEPLPPGDDGDAPPPAHDTTGGPAASDSSGTTDEPDLGTDGTNAGADTIDVPAGSSGGDVPLDDTSTDDVSSSCACTSAPRHRGAPWLLWGGLGVLARRRRRRAMARSPRLRV